MMSGNVASDDKIFFPVDDRQFRQVVYLGDDDFEYRFDVDPFRNTYIDQNWVDDMTRGGAHIMKPLIPKVTITGGSAEETEVLKTPFDHNLDEDGDQIPYNPQADLDTDPDHVSQDWLTTDMDNWDCYI